MLARWLSWWTGRPGTAEDGLAAPAPENLGLRQRVVVAALDPDVRAQPGEDGFRGGLVEDDDGVDAAEGGQQAAAVVLPGERAALTLECPDRVVAVEAHDQAVAEGTGGLQGGEVAGVQKVETASGGHHRAASGLDVSVLGFGGAATVAGHQQAAAAGQVPGQIGAPVREPPRLRPVRQQGLEETGQMVIEHVHAATSRSATLAYTAARRPAMRGHE